MESLKISTGEVRLEVKDDFGETRGIFKFNPTDIKSAQAVMELQDELAVKNDEFEARVKTCETDKEKVDFLSEMVDYFETAIDKCFGAGTSELLFGDAKTLSMFESFFEGITPYYKKASEARMAKYKTNSGK